MTTMDDLMMMEPKGDATPVQAWDCLTAWLLQASLETYEQVELKLDDAAGMGRLLSHVSCKVVGADVAPLGTRVLLRLDYLSTPVAFACTQMLGLGYGAHPEYRVLGLHGSGTQDLLQAIHNELGEKSALRKAFLYENVDEFLG